MVDTPTMPRPSGKLSLWPPAPPAPPALAVLFCVVACLSACKDQCPPLSVQEGEFCRWSRDAGVAGGSGKGGVAAAKAGRNARGGSGGATSWRGPPRSERSGPPPVTVAVSGTTGDADGDSLARVTP